MKKLTVIVTYDAHEDRSPEDQIHDVREKYITKCIKVNCINFEKDWFNGLTRIEFRGEEQI